MKLKTGTLSKEELVETLMGTTPPVSYTHLTSFTDGLASSNLYFLLMPQMSWRSFCALTSFMSSTAVSYTHLAGSVPVFVLFPN